MAGKAKLPTPKEIKALANKHKPPKFNARDKGLIAGAGFAYWSLIDLSLIKVSDLVKENGQLLDHGFLPASYSAYGKEKLFIIGKKNYFRQILQAVIDWRIENELGLLDRNLFGHLNPDSRFFLQNDGTPFSVSFRERKDKPALIEPYDMRRHFDKFLLGEGITWKTLNDAFIMNYWNDKAPEKPAQAIKDLMLLTTSDPTTIRKKCQREERSIQDILENII